MSACVCPWQTERRGVTITHANYLAKISDLKWRECYCFAFAGKVNSSERAREPHTAQETRTLTASWEL